MATEADEPGAPVSIMEGGGDDLAWDPSYEDELSDVAVSGKMNAPWPTFRHILSIRIHHNLAQYLLLSPPVPYHLLIPPTEPSSPTLPHPPSSASVDSFAIDPLEGGLGSASSSGSIGASSSTDSEGMVDATENVRSAEQDDKAKEERRKAMEEMDKAMDLTPSTPGGLVLPPFPPVRPTSSRPTTSQFGPRPITSHTSTSSTGFALTGIAGANANLSAPTAKHSHDGIPMDPRAVIGGRTLEGWPSEEEVWEEERGIRRILEGFEDEPPFTLQRLAELALSPRSSCSSPGKYLRSLTRTLLVTSAYNPNPTWTDLPLANGRPGMGSNGLRGVDNTPLFSPIPFLVKNGSYNPDGPDGRTPSPMLLENVRDAAEVGSLLVVDDGVPMDAMSERDEQIVGNGSTSTARPQTNPFLEAKPEDTDGSPSSNTSSAAQLTSIPGNPGTEPFVGRVDELDSGPLLPTAGSSTFAGASASSLASDDPHHLQIRPGDTVGAYQEGTGESGNMVPHGMAATPQAISSTTDLSRIPSNTSVSSAGSTSSEASSTKLVTGGDKPNSPETPPTSPGGTRRIARLPRSSSSSSLGSLSDRFERKEILDPDGDAEAEMDIDGAVATASQQ